MFGSVHVKVFLQIRYDDEALTVNGFDVDLVGIAGEVW